MKVRVDETNVIHVSESTDPTHHVEIADVTTCEARGAAISGSVRALLP